MAHPGGEGLTSPAKPDMVRQIAQWREAFLRGVMNPPKTLLGYTTAVVGHLNAAQVRISPRRARMLSRSLIAASIVAGRGSETLYKRVLLASLPQCAWGVEPSAKVVAAAHRAAWDTAHATVGAWIHNFLAEPTLSGKLTQLIKNCQSPDEGSQAVAQLLSLESPSRRGAFAFVAYPAALLGKLPIGAEGVHDLAGLASGMYSVNGEVSWQERLSGAGSTHPEIVTFTQVLSNLKAGRRERAEQFFNWCLVTKVVVESPEALEADIHKAANLLARVIGAQHDAV